MNSNSLKPSLGVDTQAAASGAGAGAVAAVDDADDHNVEDKSNYDTTKFVEIYGEMISESLRINNNSLVNCLDEILLVLNSYFLLINKVSKHG